MPIIKVDGTSLGYYLIAFCKTGKVRNESEAEIQEILRVLSSESITDVFIFSHGWLGDVPAAKQQYTKWIEKMAAQEADIQLMQQVRSGFRPLLIGLHWPSLPWGNERLESAIINSERSTPDLIEKQFSERIANTPKAKEALRTIGKAVIEEDIDPFGLPPEVEDAYAQLNEEAPLGNEGEGAEPGSDREPPDPQRMYKNVMEEPKKGTFNITQFAKEALLAPLRATSFWSMKARACQIGESGGSQLLEKLQQEAPTARFHLMGHSFGCIVVSAMLASPKVRGTLIRPVNSLALVQGALSLWSYCKKIPVLPAGKSRPGYFHRLIYDRTVTGPIITTYSEHDTALGKWYPLAAGVARQIDYAPDELPKYGGIGSWGIRGNDLNAVKKDMRSLEAKEPKYEFEPGRIYNLNSSKFICRKTELFRLGSRVVYDLGGAHNEIAEREVAHAVWSAAWSISTD